MDFYALLYYCALSTIYERSDKMAITLKAARVNAGLTQKEAARHLNIGKNTLANYENHKTTPTIETAEAMAKLYKMAVDEIIFFAK